MDCSQETDSKTLEQIQYNRIPEKLAKLRGGNKIECVISNCSYAKQPNIRRHSKYQIGNRVITEQLENVLLCKMRFTERALSVKQVKSYFVGRCI